MATGSIEALSAWVQQLDSDNDRGLAGVADGVLFSTISADAYMGEEPPADESFATELHNVCWQLDQCFASMGVGDLGLDPDAAVDEQHPEQLQALARITSALLAGCVQGPNANEYIEAIQSLSEEHQTTLMEVVRGLLPASQANEDGEDTATDEDEHDVSTDIGEESGHEDDEQAHASDSDEDDDDIQLRPSRSHRTRQSLARGPVDVDSSGDDEDADAGARKAALMAELEQTRAALEEVTRRADEAEARAIEAEKQLHSARRTMEKDDADAAARLEAAARDSARLEATKAELESTKQQLRDALREASELRKDAEEAQQLRDQVDVLESHKSARAQAEAAVARLRADLEAAAAQAKEAGTLQSRNRQLTDRVIELERQEARIQPLEDDLVAAREARSEAEFHLQEAKDALAAARSRAEEMRGALEASEEACRRAEAEAAALREAGSSESGGVAGAVSEYNPEVAEELSRLRAERKTLKAALEASSSDAVRDLTRQLQDVTALKDTATRNFRSKRDEASRLTEELAQAQARIETLTAELQAAQARCSNLGTQLDASKATAADLKATLGATEAALSTEKAERVEEREGLESALAAERQKHEEELCDLQTRTDAKVSTVLAEAAERVAALRQKADEEMAALQEAVRESEEAAQRAVEDSENRLSASQEAHETAAAEAAILLREAHESMAAAEKRHAGEVQKHEAAAASLREELAEEQARAAALSKQLEAAQQEAQSSQAATSQLQAQLDQAEDELMQAQSRAKRLNRELLHAREAKHTRLAAGDAGTLAAVEDLRERNQTLTNERNALVQQVEAMRRAFDAAGVSPSLLTTGATMGPVPDTKDGSSVEDAHRAASSSNKGTAARMVSAVEAGAGESNDCDADGDDDDEDDDDDEVIEMRPRGKRVRGSAARRVGSAAADMADAMQVSVQRYERQTAAAQQRVEQLHTQLTSKTLENARLSEQLRTLRQEKQDAERDLTSMALQRERVIACLSDAPPDLRRRVLQAARVGSSGHTQAGKKAAATAAKQLESARAEPSAKSSSSSQAAAAGTAAATKPLPGANSDGDDEDDDDDDDDGSYKSAAEVFQPRSSGAACVKKPVLRQRSTNSRATNRQKSIYSKAKPGGASKLRATRRRAAAAASQT